MELTRYTVFPSKRRGACHGVEAANRLEQLLGRRRHGKVVRLGAQHASSRSGHRLRRSVAFRRDGKWVDVGTIMVGEGHALWLPNGDEWAWNETYANLAEQAQAQGIRLWDPDACGAGPAPGADLEATVNWDAAGADAENPNGEWVALDNHSDRPIPLAGWYVRDSALRHFSFPPSATLPAGGRVTVRVGRGQATGDTFYWGERMPVFENPVAEHHSGDGGYVFDPDGDIRAFDMYR